MATTVLSCAIMMLCCIVQFPFCRLPTIGWTRVRAMTLDGQTEIGTTLQKPQSSHRRASPIPTLLPHLFNQLSWLFSYYVSATVVACSRRSPLAARVFASAKTTSQADGFCVDNQYFQKFLPRVFMSIDIAGNGLILLYAMYLVVGLICYVSLIHFCGKRQKSHD